MSYCRWSSDDYLCDLVQSVFLKSRIRRSKNMTSEVRYFMGPEELAVILEYRRATHRRPAYSQPRGTWAPCVRCGVAQWWTYQPFDHGTC